MPPRILLLQAREPDDPAKPEEITSFAEKAELPESAFVSHDLLTGPPSLSEVLSYDALMVGGSGEYYVSKGDLPDQQATLDLFAAIAETGHPTFASCFGFHLLTQALGGEIVFDLEGIELGTYDVTLTEAGRRDELLGVLPTMFRAQLGRKDRAARLPPGVVHLAFSERAPYQAYRLPGKPIWTTQFHPELTGEENRLRFFRYMEGYAATMDEAERRAAFDRFGDSPHTAQLIRRFLDLIA